MDDSQEILLNSLRNSGVPIPPSISTIQDLTPASLFSVCSQSLCLIDRTLSFPDSLPEDSMADRFNLCSDLASAFKHLGFSGDISFHKFLYPSEEDLYQLVRFLVSRLAESESEISRMRKSLNENQAREIEVEGLEKIVAGDEETVDRGDDEQKLASLQELSSEQKLLLDLVAKTSNSPHLVGENELLKAAAAFDSQHPVDFYIQHLNDLMEARRDQLVNLDSHQWNALRMALEDKRRNLEEAFCAMKPEAHEKLQTKKEIVRETEYVSAEIKRRQEEFFVLSAELEDQPKVASRESFVLRIKEITKNSRKQDADVEQILRETRELQLESNSIQERLNRTYAVVDETIFREARKDPVARQAYRLLTRIHECFDQTAEKVLSTDRTRREVAEYEAKLTTMASRSLNLDKLQADLDAIRKENDILERKRENN